MNLSRKWVLSILFMIPNWAGASIPIENLSGEAYTDMGHLVKGYEGGNTTIEDQYLMRLGTTITASDTIANKLQLRMGLGGIFWQPFPIGDFWQKSIKFIPNITEVSAKFLFTPNLILEGGYFPFKYNSPAMNLGEYLLRSESYPTYITTGGWTWVDSAYTRTFGIRFQASHLNGMFHHEAGIYWEYESPPLFDVTPTYLFGLEPVKGLEIGGGVALRRWLTGNFKSPKATRVDSNGTPLADTVHLANEREITRSAINVMGRLDVDFAKMLELEKTGPFKLYSELAVLGVKNQPVYYQNILQRMPVMVGLHLPTFGILDLLAVETEYLNNPYPDSKKELDGDVGAKFGGNQPVPDGVDSSTVPITFPSVHEDDWKWSLHAVKTILPGVKVKLQVANDHIRLYSFEGFTWPSASPQTGRKSHWYYLVHLQWGF